MKKAGLLLFILGAVGTLIFGIQAMQDSKSVSIGGLDVAVSSANWTPLIISAVVLVIGLILMITRK